MTINPPLGHAPALPAEKPKPSLSDIHADALKLSGLLHILDQYDPRDQSGQGGLVSLLEVASELALKVVDNLEGYV